jgi:hypothetical protein
MLGNPLRLTRYNLLLIAGTLVAVFLIVSAWARVEWPSLADKELALARTKTGNARRLTKAVGSALKASLPEGSDSAANGTQPQQPVVDFTMVALEVFQPAKGSAVRGAERTFYSRSDGSFATVVDSYDQDGAVSNRETIVGEIGRGLFRVSAADKKLIFIAPAPADASSPFPGDVKSNPNYHGEDSVLGYRTVVLRKQRKDSYTDVHYSLDLKSIIKTVTVSSAGTTTVEPTLIVPGPVNSAIFAALATFSIDTSLYRKLLEKLERIDGESAHASELVKQIEDATKRRTSS